MIPRSTFRTRLAVTSLDDRIVPSVTLPQAADSGTAYLVPLQLATGPLAGAYYDHANFGILPGTGGTGQPPRVLARQSSPWNWTETARHLLLSGRPLAQVLPQAMKAAQAFINTRGPNGEPPPTFWLDANGKVIKQTGVDAADSAYASAIRLIAAIQKAAPSDPAVQKFLNDNKVAIYNIVHNLARLADPKDALFWTFSPASKNNYTMKLLAGNSEDVSAMFAAAELALSHYRDAATANYYKSFATNGQAAILREFCNSPDIGKWRISKDASGAFGGLSATPNWDRFDFVLTYVINCDIVAGSSTTAANVVNFLMKRHPNVLKALPASPTVGDPKAVALAFSPEFGLALLKVGRTAEAKTLAQTIANAEFPTKTAKPSGYFTNRAAAGFVWLATRVK